MCDDDLTAAVRDALDPTPASEADWPVSRRDTLRALAGVGALAVGPGGAQGAAGTGIAEEAFFSNYGWESTAEGGVLTIDGAEFTFDGSKTVVLDDGRAASTVVLPDGSTASAVVGPSGEVVFDAAEIPDSGNLQQHYDASSFNLNDGDAVSSLWTDEAGSFDASVVGAPIYRSSAINGQPAVEFDGADDAFDTGFVKDTNNAETLYLVAEQTAESLEYFWGASDNGSYFQGLDGGNGLYYSGFGDGFDNPGGITQSAYRIHSIVADGSALEWFDNQTSAASYSYTGQGSIGVSTYIGARNRADGASGYLTGSIAEILRYGVAHDSTTRQDVESYLNDKYGVL